MDLIEKIKTILKTKGLSDANADLNYDNQEHVVGYISDRSFRDKSDREAQKMVWNLLKQNLLQEEFLKIIALFTETPEERVRRLTGNIDKDLKIANYWIHQSGLARYWMFVDVAKIGDDYKSCFLVISDKNNIKKGTKLTYDREVLNFMALDQDEIYSEIFSNIYGLGEVEIQTDLMNHYQQWEEKGIFGKENPYYYVYTDFKMQSVSAHQLIFTDREVQFIRENLQELKEFIINKELNKAIERSQVLNAKKRDF